MSDFEFKTPEEVIASRDENNYVEGYVSMHISDVIDNDYEGFLDILAEGLVASVALTDITYEVVGLDSDYPNTIVFKVTGDVSDLVDEDEDEGEGNDED